MRKPSVVVGHLVHMGIDVITEYESKVFRKEVGKYIVKGTPDLFDGESVVEIKFTGYAPSKKPREPDVLQLRLYLWLLDVDVGYLWYFSPIRITEFEVNDPATDEEVLELIENPRIPMWGEEECMHCVAFPCVHVLRRSLDEAESIEL